LKQYIRKCNNGLQQFGAHAERHRKGKLVKQQADREIEGNNSLDMLLKNIKNSISKF
jgi:hypothetical protein